MVGSGPPEVGRTLVGPVGHRGPPTDEGRVALLGDAELVVARPGADPVEHREGRRRSFGPGLAQCAHRRFAGGIEGGDDGIDVTPVDPSAVVDLLDVELDRLGLLAVLGIGGEPFLAGERVERDDREHHVDRVPVGSPGSRCSPSLTGVGPPAAWVVVGEAVAAEPEDVLDGDVASHTATPGDDRPDEDDGADLSAPRSPDEVPPRARQPRERVPAGAPAHPPRPPPRRRWALTTLLPHSPDPHPSDPAGCAVCRLERIVVAGAHAGTGSRKHRPPNGSPSPGPDGEPTEPIEQRARHPEPRHARRRGRRTW